MINGRCIKRVAAKPLLMLYCQTATPFSSSFVIGSSSVFISMNLLAEAWRSASSPLLLPRNASSKGKVGSNHATLFLDIWHGRISLLKVNIFQDFPKKQAMHAKINSNEQWAIHCALSSKKKCVVVIMYTWVWPLVCVYYAVCCVVLGTHKHASSYVHT